MKTFFLLLIFAIPLSVLSQGKKSIDGFLNIPFGSDSVTVIKALSAKNARKIDSLSNKDVLIFTGFDFSGRNVALCFVRFVDNKAYECDLSFIEFKESTALDYYDNLSTDIKAIYGKGDFSNNFGNSGNLARVKRLISGSAFCHTVWQSKNKNIVYLQFAHADQQSLQIMLSYKDPALGNIYEARKRSDL